MRPPLCSVLILFVTSVFSFHADAQPPLEVIQRGKRATARLESVSNRELGTAFCIDANGFFVTTARNVESPNANEGLSLTLDSGETTQQKFPATVVRMDKESHLALLKINKKLVALDFGSSDALIETASVTAFGFASRPALNPAASGVLTIRVGRITGLSKAEGKLQQIQTDLLVTPTSSGGALLDDKGRVVGILTNGMSAANSTPAIPANRIAVFLSKPEIVFEPLSVPASMQSRPQPFRFQLVSLLKPLVNPSVTFSLEEAGQPARQASVTKLDSGFYVARGVPVLPRSGSRLLNLTLPTTPTPTILPTKDREISVGKETIKLSAVARIETANGTTVLTLQNGRQLTGRIQGLEAVETQISRVPATLDLSRAAVLTVEDANPTPGFVSYTITVKAGGKTVAVREGTLLIEGNEASIRRGMLLVCADFRLTQFEAFANGTANSDAQTRRYILNIARLFTGGKRGKFLVLSIRNTYGTPFQETLRQAGHTVVQTERAPASLEDYDAVFTDGTSNRRVIAPYVQRGGKVYLASGRGADPSWEDTLRPFGMSFGRGTNPNPMRIALFGKHPLFDGINELLINDLTPIQLLPGEFPNTKVLVQQNNIVYWALYVGKAIASEPKTTLPNGMVLGNPVLNPANGHWYRSVVVPEDITWTAAKRAAEQLTYRGWRGHLITITSEAENQFASTAFPEVMTVGCWLGGYQDTQASDFREPDGGWRWVTGEKWSYSIWNHGLYQEPNDGLGGHEDFLSFTSEGRWNDVPDVRSDRMRGFIVEFEKYNSVR